MARTASPKLRVRSVMGTGMTGVRKAAFNRIKNKSQVGEYEVSESDFRNSLVLRRASHPTLRLFSNGRVVYMGAKSESHGAKAIGALTKSLRKALGRTVSPVTPETPLTQQTPKATNIMATTNIEPQDLASIAERLIAIQTAAGSSAKFYVRYRTYKPVVCVHHCSSESRYPVVCIFKSGAVMVSGDDVMTHALKEVCAALKN